MGQHALLDALDTVLAEDLAGLRDTSLNERAAALLAAGDRVAGLLASTIREVEARGLAGCPMNPWGRTEQWLAGLPGARHSRAELVRHTARARAAGLVPLVADLHAAGEVSTAFADAARAGARQLPAEARPGWDALLAGEARDTLPTDIPTLLTHLKTMIDPDAVDERAARAADRSGLWISPYGHDGQWAITGTLHGLEGQLFASLINHYAQPRDADDTRTAAERRAAALGQILRIAQRSTDDPEFRAAPHGQSAHLVVLITDDTWHAQPGSPAATTPTSGTATPSTVDPGQLAALRCANPIPDTIVFRNAEATTGDERGEDVGPDTGTGTADTDADFGEAPADTVSAPLTDAAVEAAQLRHLLAGLVGSPVGARIEPLRYGRGLRAASRAQWFALTARDHHCVEPGCGRDPSWCEAHHTREWDADGGLTNLEHLALLCWEHHTALHRTRQHLHPPWCHCHTCHSTTTWTEQKHPPEFTVQ